VTQASSKQKKGQILRERRPAKAYATVAIAPIRHEAPERAKSVTEGSPVERASLIQKLATTNEERCRFGQCSRLMNVLSCRSPEERRDVAGGLGLGRHNLLLPNKRLLQSPPS
jgi:hypothetical protein